MDQIRSHMKVRFLGWLALSSLLHVFIIGLVPYADFSADAARQSPQPMEVGLVDKPAPKKEVEKTQAVHTQPVKPEGKPRFSPPQRDRHHKVQSGRPAEQESATVPYEIEGHVNVDYMARMRRRIMVAWDYPDNAISKGLEGKAKIGFEIDRSGRLLEQAVIKSSGYADLDRAALLAIRKASPFGRFPPDINEETLKIKWYFQYRLD